MEISGIFPDPAVNSAKIVVKLTRDAELFLKIYDVSGEIVRRINTKGVNGYNVIVWDLRNSSYFPVSSGVYLFSVEAVVSEKEKIKKFNKMSVVR
jgi:flagellar hook assembly protein FlgD